MNGEEYEDFYERFKHISDKGDLALANRCFYIAFLICHDTEFYGTYTNFYDYDCCLDEDAVEKIYNFVSFNNINSLSRLHEYRNAISDFLFMTFGQD